MTEKVLVQHLRDILATFPALLSQLPADVNVHKAQRAVTVLEGSLRELKEKI